MAASGKKVLIADDEPDVHVFVRTALEDEGYQILSVSDGEAALRVARAEKPDLVILDVQMPGKSGFDVFDELRKSEATGSIPVIMLTAVSQRTGLRFSEEDMGELYTNEPEAFIDKPVDPDALRETVARLLGR